MFLMARRNIYKILYDCFFMSTPIWIDLTKSYSTEFVLENHPKLRSLNFKFQGRRYRLTDVHGEVIKEILS